jgi:hypothetical protein
LRKPRVQHPEELFEPISVRKRYKALFRRSGILGGEKCDHQPKGTFRPHVNTLLFAPSPELA